MKDFIARIWMKLLTTENGNMCIGLWMYISAVLAFFGNIGCMIAGPIGFWYVMAKIGSWSLIAIVIIIFIEGIRRAGQCN